MAMPDWSGGPGVIGFRVPLRMLAKKRRPWLSNTVAVSPSEKNGVSRGVVKVAPLLTEVVHEHCEPTISCVGLAVFTFTSGSTLSAVKSALVDTTGAFTVPAARGPGRNWTDR